MKRRALTIALHWASFMLILVMVKGGTALAAVQWTFVAIVAVWAGMTAVKGLLGKPGPKLPAAMASAYPWMHRTLMLTLTLTAAAMATELVEIDVPWLDAWTLLLITLAMGTFHGLFHLWRHTALYDNALRMMTPKFMHHLL